MLDGSCFIYLDARSVTFIIVYDLRTFFSPVSDLTYGPRAAYLFHANEGGALSVCVPGGAGGGGGGGGGQGTRIERQRGMSPAGGRGRFSFMVIAGASSCEFNRRAAAAAPVAN